MKSNPASSLNKNKIRKNKKNIFILKIFSKSRNANTKQKKQRKETRFKHKLTIFKKLAILIITLTLFGWSYVMVTRNLKIKDIECYEDESGCKEFIKKKFNSAIELSPPKSMARVKKIIVEDNLSEKYSVNYSFPYKLIVKLDKRIAVVALKEKSGWHVLLDKDGFAVEIVESTDLITIEANTGFPNVGEKANDNVLPSALLTGKLNKLAQVEKVSLLQDKLEVKIKHDDILYIFPTQGDSDYLSGAFNLLLSRLNNHDKESTIEKSRITEVDFRYKNPVIRGNFGGGIN